MVASTLSRTTWSRCLWTSSWLTWITGIVCAAVSGTLLIRSSGLDQRKVSPTPLSNRGTPKANVRKICHPPVGCAGEYRQEVLPPVDGWSLSRLGRRLPASHRLGVGGWPAGHVVAHRQPRDRLPAHLGGVAAADLLTPLLGHHP